jgi:hypothetical protein
MRAPPLSGRCAASRSLTFDGFQDRGSKIAGESGRVLRRRPHFCLQKLQERRRFGRAVEVESKTM